MSGSSAATLLFSPLGGRNQIAIRLGTGLPSTVGGGSNSADTPWPPTDSGPAVRRQTLPGTDSGSSGSFGISNCILCGPAPRGVITRPAIGARPAGTTLGAMSGRGRPAVFTHISTRPVPPGSRCGTHICWPFASSIGNERRRTLLVPV
jgi:hypothetical protein